MDLWKLLILGLIAAGLLLILWTPPEAPNLPEGFRVETGTFRHRTSSEIREELFGVYPVDVGFRVVCILHERGRVLVEADFLYGPDWTPLAGTLVQRHPQEIRWLFALDAGGITVRKQVGPRESLETLSLSEPVYPGDGDLLGLWYPLFRAGPGESLALWDVRRGRVIPVRLGVPEEVQLSVLGRAVPLERWEATWEGGGIRFYRQGELLLGARAEGFEAYLVEVLPEGIQEVP